ncbi:hypothetical protein [uncultured Desulfovibrio sp.]|uniref:hypothetical protein n=1 Tax=uncultured Desulfovibrio sp. TaxID=167968 RepID=UPI002624CF07|nr:hypothetical protein [uncultured Desulfovibrio sp.]
MAEAPLAPRFFPQAVLARRVPWPTAALGAPLNPARDLLRSAEAEGAAYIRLAYALFYLPPEEGTELLGMAAREGREVLAADFKPPERNLELPACLLARGLLGAWPGLWPGTRGGTVLTAFLARGGLEGLALRAGLHVSSRRTLLGGAAVLLELNRREDARTDASA